MYVQQEKATTFYYKNSISKINVTFIIHFEKKNLNNNLGLCEKHFKIKLIWTTKYLKN